MEALSGFGWAEFGLAGLFGLFAIIITSMFLKFLKTQQELFRTFLEAERISVDKRHDKLDTSLRDLTSAIRTINGG